MPHNHNEVLVGCLYMAKYNSGNSLKRWMPFLIITGLITAAVCMIPELVSMGAFFFIVPGIIFFFTPPIFFYITGLLILSVFTSRMGLGGRIAPLIIASFIVMGIPYTLNQDTYHQTQGLIADDIDIQQPVVLRDSIAFIVAPPRGYNARDPVKCSAQCQKLLYNGAVKNVMIGKLPSFNVDDIATYNVKSFFIEKKDECLGNIKAIDPVNRRIASGECLMSETVSLANAQTIHVHQIIRDDRLKSDLYLKANTIKAKRNRILERTGIRYKTVYQKTDVQAKPLSYPLIFGVIPKYGLDMDIGFVRTNLVINDFEKISKDETNKKFGDALRIPSEPTVELGKKTDAKSLIKKAFVSTGDKKTAGHDLFEQYLRELIEKKITPTDEDIELVITALKDDRAGGWFYLSRFIGSLGGNVPSSLIQELGNRLVRTKSISTSNAIRFLPDGMASEIYPQLLIAFKDNDLRNKAWGAISRLGDGKKEALLSYISVLEEWNVAINSSNYNARKMADRNLSKVTTGALIGVCRMGHEAAPAKEVLFSVVRPDRPQLTISMLAVDALIEIGAFNEIKEKYENNEQLWQEIQRAVAQRDRAIKKNRRFCGKRIV